MDNIYDKLREEVELMCGYKPQVIHHFNDLAKSVQSVTEHMLSATTLRRFWGYQEREKHIKASRYTLDALAQYVGYQSWMDYCECKSNPRLSNSRLLHNECLYSSKLAIGTVVRLIWKPNRQMWVRFLGDNKWVVEKSINGKLSKGYTFYCASFIRHQLLMLTDVSKDGSRPTGYCCGIDGGIDYHIEHYPHP